MPLEKSYDTAPRGKPGRLKAQKQIASLLFSVLGSPVTFYLAVE
jgi:hypothetical protein